MTVGGNANFPYPGPGATPYLSNAPVHPHLALGIVLIVLGVFFTIGGVVLATGCYETIFGICQTTGLNFAGDSTAVLGVMALFAGIALVMQRGQQTLRPGPGIYAQAPPAYYAPIPSQALPPPPAPVAARYCPSCGAGYVGSVAFCNRCGAPIPIPG